jgi:hypothetical protein
LLFIIAPGLFFSGVVIPKIFVVILGILGMLFFGIPLLYTTRKLTNKKLGLIIDEFGITNNSGAYNFGLIEWKDIQVFKLATSPDKQLILIETSKAEKYISRIKSPVFKKDVEQNQRLYGSSMVIRSHLLNANPSELEKLLNEELMKRK